jgi:hypothetical protein
VGARVLSSRGQTIAGLEKHAGGALGGNQLLVDCSAGTQRYVEDCQVCCRPMNVSVSVDMNGDPFVDVRREDD